MHKKACYICIIEYYSTIKISEPLVHGTTWMKNIMLNEISQRQKTTYDTALCI